MKRVLLILVITLALSAAVFASNTETKRYVVYSDNPILKKTLGVRYEFPGKFTTSLTPMQVNLLKSMGVKVREVKVYYIKDIKGQIETKNSDILKVSVSKRYYPSDQTPWGIEKIYNDPTITKTSGGAGINVAVLDTGVYTDHPDLKNRIKQCVDFTGIVSPVVGKCKDLNGHGTHVSGTILADGGSDGKGIYGVAPEANLLAYKVCNAAGFCYEDDIAAAINYAGNNGANIVSMSFGSDSPSDLIYAAIKDNSNILYVAAAGNDGPDLGSIDYPAAYPEVIAVAAINISDYVADWSSRGINGTEYNGIDEKEIEVAAPGVNIESTWNNGGYKVLSGTSMATPHISGLAAKYWSTNTSMSKDDVRKWIQERASMYDIVLGIFAGSGYDPASGFGLPTVGQPFLFSF
jgi:subtilisin